MSALVEDTLLPQDEFSESEEPVPAVEITPRELIAMQLDELAMLQATRDKIAAEKEERRKKLVAQVLTPDQIELLRDIDANLETEFEHRFYRIQSGIDAKTEAVKSHVKELKESVKGASLHAVFCKGRISWDDKCLQGFAIVHPAILEFRKEGEPSVAIRTIKGE